MASVLERTSVLKRTSVLERTSVLKRVEIDGCDGKRVLSVEALCRISEEVEVESRCCVDAIWRVRVAETPTRLIRLFKGAQSLSELLNRYSLSDASGCSYSEGGAKVIVHNLFKNAQGAGITLPAISAEHLRSRSTRRVYGHRPPRMASSSELAIMRPVGMPQRTARSGVCWFGALCWAAMRPSGARRVFLHHVRDPNFREALRQCIAEPEIAEGLRRRMFYELRLGDDPVNTRPEDEGQNGFTLLSLMCARLGVPLTVLVLAEKDELVTFAYPLADADKKMVDPPRPPTGTREPALLGVRVHRGHWRPPHTLLHGGRTYHLQSAMIGSEFCGHQCALARSRKNVYHFYDSDAVRLGIGPVGFRSDRDELWKALQYVLPYSNNTPTSKFCDFSPHNRSPVSPLVDNLRAERAMAVLGNADTRAPKHRLVNVDWLYSTV